ncbi:hypothetical protein C4D60_Mb10t05160 [Musa balbisiana]|uniref:Uncharacterized protein n=1 Tax=Musa balbisiana TaxID=52838 RepID=A0A4S8IUV9_MUSBA|nr:hypothetical protein C4D60_Mb10t05160 [Musa balbisiana]
MEMGTEMERDANGGDGARPPPFRSLHASAIACSSSSSSTPHWSLNYTTMRLLNFILVDRLSGKRKSIHLSLFSVTELDG